jgi:hypothetical protein
MKGTLKQFFVKKLEDHFEMEFNVNVIKNNGTELLDKSRLLRKLTYNVRLHSVCF